jgi:predicted ATPase/DNA-binding XRE family transcriptional regulator
MDAPPAFGELLRRYRAAAGLTQEELAERAALSARGIADLERGVRTAPYPRTVRQLADVLGLAADEHALLFAARGRAYDARRDTGEGARGHVRPQPPTPLVGREREVQRLSQRLLDERVRLLTLTGTGGTGKTRLALELASELHARFDCGAWFIDLTPIREPALVLPEIARVLGAHHESSRPIKEALEQFLRNKQLLLVLDNCEQVVAFAPDIGTLLERCPGVQVLATSREPLRLRSERLYPVPPLGLPPADATVPLHAVTAAPAVALFVQRAQNLQPDFRLSDATVRAVAELCRHLDGLPLAIELAAAHVTVLPPAALLARMERRLDLLRATTQDVPARHQTLRAAIDWSYELLSDSERAVFRRMAIFAGGCSLEAAEVVCQPGGTPGIGVLDQLESLVRKGLVKCEDAEGQPRFGMLETIREYASEALEQSGEQAAVTDAHAAYYLELAEVTEPLLHGEEQLLWFRRLDHERANFRAAFRWFADSADELLTESALRLAGALWWYWHVRGAHAEARELVGALLELPTAQRPSLGRARALATYGVMTWGLGDAAGGLALHDESLILTRQYGDAHAVAEVLMHAAVAASFMGDLPRATAACSEALELARNAAADHIASSALSILGRVAMLQGDVTTAHGRLSEALAISRRGGDAFGMALALNGLGAIARQRGDVAEAGPLYEEALTLFRALGERPNVAAVLASLGEVALAEHDHATAGARFRESLVVYHEMGSVRGIGVGLAGLASLAAAEDQHVRALRLTGAAAALGEATGVAFEVFGNREAEASLAGARRELGKGAAAAAWTAGLTMSPDEAVRYALATGERGIGDPHDGRADSHVAT